MATTCDPSDVFSLRTQFVPTLRFALYRLLRTSLRRGVSCSRLISHLRREADLAITAELLPVIAYLDERFRDGCHLSESLAPLLPPEEALLFSVDHDDRYPDVLEDASVLARAAFPHQGASDPTPGIAAIAFALETDDGLEFLRCWNEGDFAAIRREWPEAPAEVFIGADPLHEPTLPRPAASPVRQESALPVGVFEEPPVMVLSGGVRQALAAVPRVGVAGVNSKVEAFAPSRALLCKLGSILVHLDEHESAGGHAFDRVALDALRADPEVKAWLAELDGLSLLPKKRG